MSWETYNKLVVSGPSLEAFKKWLDVQPLDSDAIALLPNDLREARGLPIWNPYDDIWNNYRISEEGGAIIIIFMTRRSTPELSLKALSKMFPEMIFHCSIVYDDRCWATIFEINNGITHSEDVNMKDSRFRGIAEAFADAWTGISCNMNLVVSGPKLKDFATWLGDDPLSLTKILPIPDDLGSFCGKRDSLLPDPNVALRQWCIQHWGTPTDIEPVNYSFEYTNYSHELSLSFDTFWSPPIPAIKILSRKFPDAKFVLTYWMHELVAGVFTFQNGKTSGDESDERHSLYHHVMSEMRTCMQDKEVEGLAGQGSDLDLSGYPHLSAAYMRILSRHKGHLGLGLRALSDEGAAALSEHEGSISFSVLSYLTDGAAKALAKHKGDMFLSGITELTDNAAEFLSKHEGLLWLNDLESLSDAAATSLARHQGQVGLCGLKRVSDKACEMLAAQNVLRSPDSLTSLSVVQAESLWGLRKEPLYLNNLETLSDETAEVIAEHEGEISFNRLTTLSDVAAEALAKHKGRISLNGLSTLSAHASKVLFEHGAVKTNLDLGKLCKGKDAKGDGATNKRAKSLDWETGNNTR